MSRQTFLFDGVWFPDMHVYDRYIIDWFKVPFLHHNDGDIEKESIENRLCKKIAGNRWNRSDRLCVSVWMMKNVRLNTNYDTLLNATLNEIFISIENLYIYTYLMCISVCWIIRLMEI